MLYVKPGDKGRFSYCKIVHYQEVLTKVPCRLSMTSMGAELQSQNRVDVNYKKTFGLGA